MSDTAAAATGAPAGEAGQQGAPAAGTQGAQAPTPADAAAAAAAAAAAGTQQQATQGQQGTDGDRSEPWNDPAAARAEIERLRKQNGDDRANAKNAARAEGKSEASQDIAKALLGVLGVSVPGEEAATPEQLAEQIGNVTSERDAAKLDAALTRTAYELGVDPGKLDYVAFKLSKGEKLDVSAPDFSDKLKASLTALVAEDATLKRPGAAQVSGVQNLAGSGGADTITQERFDAMNMAERTKLFHDDRAAYDRLTGR